MNEFEALRREYREHVIGPQMMSVVRDVAASVCKRFPPHLYGAPGTAWTTDAIDDLVQDVVTSQLLSYGQLDYVWTVADTTDSVKRLLARLVRRTLVARRTPSVVDNLIRRSRELIRDAPFVSEERGRDLVFTLRGRTPTTRSLTEDELKLLAVGVSGVRKRPSKGSERAPAVYSTDDLRAMLVRLAKDSPSWLTIRDLDAVFRSLLTSWLVTPLEDAYETDIVAAALSPEELAISTRAVEALMGQLSAQERTIFRLKAAMVSDGDLGKLLGVSRPTLAKRKEELYRRVFAELGDLPDAILDAAANTLLAVILQEADDADAG